MVTAMPMEILRFMSASSLSEQQHHENTAQQREYKHPASSRQAMRSIRLRFCSFIKPDSFTMDQLCGNGM